MTPALSVHLNNGSFKRLVTSVIGVSYFHIPYGHRVDQAEVMLAFFDTEEDANKFQTRWNASPEMACIYTVNQLRMEETFIKKWKNRSSIPIPDKITPARLYWELVFEDVKGWDQVTMSEDLLNVYPGDEYKYESVLYARNVVNSTR